MKRLLVSAWVLFCCLSSFEFAQDIMSLNPPAIARIVSTDNVQSIPLTIYGNYFYPPCTTVDNNNFCPSSTFPLVTFGVPGNPNLITVNSRQKVPSSDPNNPAPNFPRPSEVLQVTIPASLIMQSGAAPNPGYSVQVQTGVNQSTGQPIYGASATLPADWRIDTVAGTGTGTYDLPFGRPTQVSLQYPNGVTFDQAGNMYIADTYNNCIRQVNFATNMLTTFAGACTATPRTDRPPNDDGPAASALMYGPFGLTFDPTYSYLYFADTGNNLIRRVNMSTNMVETLAGHCVSTFCSLQNGCNPERYICKADDAGDGMSARTAFLTSPRKVIFDNNTGNQLNMYIVDNGNHRIRRVNNITSDPTTAMIYAFACDPANPLINGNCQGYSDGTTPNFLATAKFNFPSDILFSPDFARMYVADYQNQRVRSIDMVQGQIRDLVGNGNAGYVPTDSGIPATPLTSVTLNSPVNLALDSTNTGNLFIADRHNLRIRELFASNLPYTFQSGIKTFVGNGTAGFSGNTGLATNAQIYHATGMAWNYSQNPSNICYYGCFYLADNHNHQIRRLSK